jgi:hypothetical protein
MGQMADRLKKRYQGRDENGFELAYVQTKKKTT